MDVTLGLRFHPVCASNYELNGCTYLCDCLNCLTAGQFQLKAVIAGIFILLLFFSSMVHFLPESGLYLFTIPACETYFHKTEAMV